MDTNPTTRPQPIFSPEDADLAALKWRFHHKGYPTRGFYLNGGKTVIMAHRIILERILGRKPSTLEHCDHINGIKHDNRRENLRAVSPLGNAQNRRDKTGFRGASYIRSTNKWAAKVRLRGKHIWCGQYATRAEAAEAARRKREELGFLTGAEAAPAPPTRPTASP